MRIAIAGLLALMLASISAPARTAEPVRVLFVGRWADLQPDDAPAFPDGGHPSFAASLVIAATLYESVVGKAPVAAEMLIDFPLLVPRVPISSGEPLEAQHDLGVPARPIRLVAGAVAPYLEAASALR